MVSPKYFSATSIFLLNTLSFLEQFWVDRGVEQKVQRTPAYAPPPSPEPQSVAWCLSLALVWLQVPAVSERGCALSDGIPVR